MASETKLTEIEVLDTPALVKLVAHAREIAEIWRSISPQTRYVFDGRFPLFGKKMDALVQVVFAPEGSTDAR